MPGPASVACRQCILTLGNVLLGDGAHQTTCNQFPEASTLGNVDTWCISKSCSEAGLVLHLVEKRPLAPDQHFAHGITHLQLQQSTPWKCTADKLAPNARA